MDLDAVYFILWVNNVRVGAIAPGPLNREHQATLYLHNFTFQPSQLMLWPNHGTSLANELFVDWKHRQIQNKVGVFFPYLVSKEAFRISLDLSQRDMS